MAAPVYELTAYFDVSSSSNLFILDDPVRGVLDSAYVLAGDIAQDVSSYLRSFTINRGVSRQYDRVSAGTCTLVLNNRSRAFDQFYSAGPYYGNILPGKRMTVKVAGAIVFDGEVESYRYGYDRNSVPIVTVTLVDALSKLAQKQLAPWTTTAGQLPGARLVSMLDRAEVLFPANRAIGTGVSTLQADVVTQNTNALTYAQLVARSDFGRFFASRNNALTFLDRHANLNAGPSITFINDGTGIKFDEPERLSGTEFLWNYVVAGRRGGSTQIFKNQASIDEYGILSPPDDMGFTDLIVETDSLAYDYGLYLATNYSTPEDRFSSFTVKMHALTGADQTLVSSLDIGSLVRGVYQPSGFGETIDRYCVVEGIKHQAQRNTHKVTVYVGDAVNRSAFILDDPIFGVLDGPGVLVF